MDVSTVDLSTHVTNATTDATAALATDNSHQTRKHEHPLQLSASDKHQKDMHNSNFSNLLECVEALTLETSSPHSQKSVFPPLVDHSLKTFDNLPNIVVPVSRSQSLFDAAKKRKKT